MFSNLHECSFKPYAPLRLIYTNLKNPMNSCSNLDSDTFTIVLKLNSSVLLIYSKATHYTFILKA